jgi:flagellin-like hook-associated protein FlgL
LLTSLNNGHGFPLGKIRIINGLDFQDVDLAPLANDPAATVMDVIRLINSAGIDVEAAINDQHTGITIRSTVEGRSLQVIEADQGRTAKDLGIFGSPDLLGNMMIARRALERNSPEELNLALETFDGALNRVLVERSDVGARVNRAEVAETRLLSFEVQVTSQLSNVEDADITKVITDMAAAESVYQSALASAARMLQPSLIDFLS